MKVSAVTVAALDGYELAATLYEPSTAVTPARAALIASATAVGRRYYQAFARYLADRGLAVLTFDYRGIGESRPRSLKGFRCAMHDWGANDLAGAIDWLDRRFPGGQLVGVGHSAGGQLFGLAANNQRLRALLTVGAQSGYWGLWPAPRKYWLFLVWTLVMPLLTRLFGYFPARLLRLGPELPRGVALEWARWCRDPDYVNGRARPPSADAFGAFRGPLQAISFADDTFAPQAAVDRLASFYTKAALERRHLTPAEIGLPAVGHFGFFRDGCRSLWVAAADWLLQR
jgi:predicted alpha/beta hydrolase